MKLKEVGNFQLSQLGQITLPATPLSRRQDQIILGFQQFRKMRSVGH
jgi:hypothetical protein